MIIKTAHFGIGLHELGSQLSFFTYFSSIDEHRKRITRMEDVRGDSNSLVFSRSLVLKKYKGCKQNEPSECNGHSSHLHGLARTCTQAHSLLHMEDPWSGSHGQLFLPC